MNTNYKLVGIDPKFFFQLLISLSAVYVCVFDFDFPFLVNFLLFSLCKAFANGKGCAYRF